LISVESPVLDSYQFSIVMRVRVLTSTGKTHVSSVPQDFTYGTPPRFDLTFIDSKVLFTSQTYILSNDPVNLELFLE
jgi:hypothetical protein